MEQVRIGQLDMTNNLEEDSSGDLSGEVAESDLSLPATGLRVTESALILERKNGAEIASWPLSELSNVRALRQLNPFGLVLIGSASAMLYIALSVSMYWWVAIGLYVLATLCCLVGLLVIIGPILRFSYRGKTINIQCDDEFVMVDAVAKILNFK